MGVFDSGKKITVIITGNTAGLNKSFGEAVRQAQGFSGKMAVIGNQMKAMVGPALIGAAAAAGAFAVKLGVDGVKAAMEEEKQLAILKQTLDNVGQGFAMDEVNTFIDNLRFATGVADDELRPAFMKLVGATKDASAAQRLLQASVDASVGSGKDLSSVSQAVAKAVAGSGTALKRLIPELDATALKGGGAAKVIAALTDRFGGSASAAANTFAGQIQRLQDGFAELQESFGKGFLQSLERSNDQADQLSQTLRDLQPAAENLGRDIGSLANAFSGLGAIVSWVNSVGDMMPDWLTRTFAIVRPLVDPVQRLVVLFTGIGLASNDASGPARQLSDQFTDTGKSAAILGEIVGNETTPNFFNMSDAAASTSDSIALLREDIKLTTRSLGPLAAAFDEANAAMDRRQAMQDYRDALKAFIAEPSGETRDAAVRAMQDVTESFTDPKDAIKFTGQAMGDLTAAAKDAGIKIPPDIANIQSAFEVAQDPIARVKQLMEEIPENIRTTIAMNVTVNGKYFDPYGGYDGTSATGGPFATGGYLGAAMGTHASDSITARLSRGEYVLNADTVRRLGVGTLNRVNNGGAMNGTGVMIQQLTVESAPGERAEESVPRALRRLAFVAGLGV